MNTPTIYTPSQLQDWPSAVAQPDGSYIPSRPIAWSLSLFHPRRWKIAWRVFTGRFDALDWERVLPDSPTAKELEKMAR